MSDFCRSSAWVLTEFPVKAQHLYNSCALVTPELSRRADMRLPSHDDTDCTSPRDIKERREAEQALAERRARCRSCSLQLSAAARQVTTPYMRYLPQFRHVKRWHRIHLVITSTLSTISTLPLSLVPKPIHRSEVRPTSRPMCLLFMVAPPRALRSSFYLPSVTFLRHTVARTTIEGEKRILMQGNNVAMG